MTLLDVRNGIQIVGPMFVTVTLPRAGVTRTALARDSVEAARFARSLKGYENCPVALTRQA